MKPGSNGSEVIVPRTTTEGTDDMSEQTKDGTGGCGKVIVFTMGTGLDGYTLREKSWLCGDRAGNICRECAKNLRDEAGMAATWHELYDQVVAKADAGCRHVLYEHWDGMVYRCGDTNTDFCIKTLIAERNAYKGRWEALKNRWPQAQRLGWTIRAVKDIEDEFPLPAEPETETTDEGRRT